MDFTLTFIRLFFWSIYLIAPLLVFLSFVIIVLGQIVCYIEKWNKFDGLYWSFITATTVGYGDIHPLKKVSKVLSVFIALVGIMLTGIMLAVTLNRYLSHSKSMLTSVLLNESKRSLIH
jgi:voltage-gated potassium channel